MVETGSLRDAPRYSAGDWLGTLPPMARFILQGESSVRAAAAQVLGVPTTEEPCQARSAGERALLWLGPDEFLLQAPASERESLGEQLATALKAGAHSLVDVSHRQLTLELRGRNASLLLASGCPLDLDLRAFPVGMCTRTVFAKAEIVLWRIDSMRFRLDVWRSFADYVTRWLTEAALDLAD